MNSATQGLAAVISLLLFASGCATSSPAGPADVQLRLEQLPDAGFAVEKRGAVSVAYQMTVRNGTADAITLRKVEMKTSIRSPYTLRDEPAILSEVIEPGKEALVTFTMWSDSRGERSKSRSTVFVSGIAHFDSAKGSFQKPFTQYFREP